jgi:hypothetical protein
MRGALSLRPDLYPDNKIVMEQTGTANAGAGS